jgi:hypothetical protein
LAVNYKLETAQTLVDDYNNVSSALDTMIEENSIDQSDVKEIVITPVGTSFLVLIAWKGIEALIRTYTFAAVKIGLVSAVIKKLVTLSNIRVTPLALANTWKRRLTINIKPAVAAIRMGVKIIGFSRVTSNKRRVAVALKVTLTSDLDTTP